MVISLERSHEHRALEKAIGSNCSPCRAKRVVCRTIMGAHRETFSGSVDEDRGVRGHSDRRLHRLVSWRPRS